MKITYTTKDGKQRTINAEKMDIELDDGSIFNVEADNSTLIVYGDTIIVFPQSPNEIQLSAM